MWWTTFHRKTLGMSYLIAGVTDVKWWVRGWNNGMMGMRGRKKRSEKRRFLLTLLGHFSSFTAKSQFIIIFIHPPSLCAFMCRNLSWKSHYKKKRIMKMQVKQFTIRFLLLAVIKWDFNNWFVDAELIMCRCENFTKYFYFLIDQLPLLLWWNSPRATWTFILFFSFETSNTLLAFQASILCKHLLGIKLNESTEIIIRELLRV